MWPAVWVNSCDCIAEHLSSVGIGLHYTLYARLIVMCFGVPLYLFLLFIFLCTMCLNSEIKQRDTSKDRLLFLVQHSGIHSHCLFVIHHWHWLSSVRVWRLCYSAEH